MRCQGLLKSARATGMAVAVVLTSMGAWASHIGLLIDGTTDVPQVWRQEAVFGFVDLHVATQAGQAVVSGLAPALYFSDVGTQQMLLTTGAVREWFQFSVSDPISDPFDLVNQALVQPFVLTYRLLAPLDEVPPGTTLTVDAGSLPQTCVRDDIGAPPTVVFRTPPCEAGEFAARDLRESGLSMGFLLFTRAQAVPLPPTLALVALGLAVVGAARLRIYS